MSNPKEEAPPASALLQVAVTGGIPILAIATPTGPIKHCSGQRLAHLILQAYAAQECTVELPQ